MPPIETPATPAVQDTTQAAAVADKKVEDVFYGDTPKPEDAKPAETAALDASKPADAPKIEEKPADAPATKDVPKPDEKPSETAKKEEVVYDLKLPKDTKLEATVVNEVTALAKQHGLTNEAAQTILDREHAADARFEQRQTQEYQALQKQWISDAQADKEVGGARLEQAAADSKTAIDRYAPPEFVELLESTGYGNHPLVLKTFARIGEAMRGGRFVSPQSQPKAEITMQEAFYGPDK